LFSLIRWGLMFGLEVSLRRAKRGKAHTCNFAEASVSRRAADPNILARWNRAEWGRRDPSPAPLFGLRQMPKIKVASAFDPQRVKTRAGLAPE